MFTIVLSSTSISWAIPMTARTHHRRVSPGDVGAIGGSAACAAAWPAPTWLPAVLGVDMDFLSMALGASRNTGALSLSVNGGSSASERYSDANGGPAGAQGMLLTSDGQKPTPCRGAHHRGQLRRPGRHPRGRGGDVAGRPAIPRAPGPSDGANAPGLPSPAHPQQRRARAHGGLHRLHPRA